ncbi:MAG: flagellar basal body L-ring protein FlgH [Planctomycetes bacterium]|nr:flagellar basal body L-ring protein FlgH [Planctomycetota bacterium]
MALLLGVPLAAVLAIMPGSVARAQSPTQPQSLWDRAFGGGGAAGGAAGSLYVDVPAKPTVYQPHDLITVLIEESALATMRNDLKLEGDTKVQTELADFIRFSGEGKGTAKIVPALLNRGKPKIDFESGLELERKGTGRRVSQYTDRITCEIVAVYPNGTLEISGQKVRTINGERETVKVSGVVHPRDINTDPRSANYFTVPSKRLGNANLELTGKGDLSDWTQLSWFQKFLGVVWPF